MIRILLTLSLALAAGIAFGEDAKPAAKVVPYPLDTCAVSGEKLGEMCEAVTKVYDGREVKFCCDKCVPKFEKDKAKYLKAIDEKAAAAAKSGKPEDKH